MTCLRRSFCLAFSVLIMQGPLGFGQISFAQDLASTKLPQGLPVADFGEEGEQVPEFVRDLLPSNFFTMPMTEPLANRKNYTALWWVPEALETHSLRLDGESTSAIVEAPIRNLEMRLILGNDGKARNDVSISATSRDGREVRNFLVGVESGARMTLDVGMLRDFDTIYFLSLQAFSASVEILADGQRSSYDLEVMEPVRRTEIAAQSGSIFCAEIQRYIDICLAGSCVTAWADRYATSHTWYDGDPVYFVDVDYPSQGNAFHIGNGAGASFWDPECKQSAYSTRRDDLSKRHRWLGLDNTLFSCLPSTAMCTSGCSDTFQIDCH